MSDSTDLSGRLECALFAPQAGRAEIEKLCADAQEKSYYAICVNGFWVELARSVFDESESRIRVVALVGFPLGACDTDTKRYETEVAVDHGAHEIDFVLNIGRIKNGDRRGVQRELRDVAEAADERPVKVIIESHLLTREDKILACELALDSGVKFISLATDFHSPDASVADVTFLRETLGADFGIKAAGNIRTAQMAQELIDAGATRLGIISGAGSL